MKLSWRLPPSKFSSKKPKVIFQISKKSLEVSLMLEELSMNNSVGSYIEKINNFKKKPISIIKFVLNMKRTYFQNITITVTERTFSMILPTLSWLNVSTESKELLLNLLWNIFMNGSRLNPEKSKLLLKLLIKEINMRAIRPRLSINKSLILQNFKRFWQERPLWRVFSLENPRLKKLKVLKDILLK